jgi:IS30 family transposase
MNALAVMLKPINFGWAVTLTNGCELARFMGLGARRKALSYIANRDFVWDAGRGC